MSAGAAPEISVLIATHNRRDLLERCLAAFDEQTQASSSFEVVVAVDGSTDGSAEMLSEVDRPYGLQVLKLEQGGQAAALNAAIEAARAPVCIFLDDDEVASPEFVATHLAAHAADPEVLGIGHLVQTPPADGNLFGTLFAEDWNARHEKLQRGEVDWADCYGGNFSAPRRTLQAVGGFSTGMDAVEDLDLSYRLSTAGCRPRYLPQAVAVHDDDKPPSRLLFEEERFGAFCAAFVREHPDARKRLVGWFHETSAREILLQRLLLTVRVRPSLLYELGAVLPPAARRTWFGFVARYAFWRGVRRGMTAEEWQRTTRGVPVLMYHAFTDSGERDRWVMPIRTFARQMALLSAMRYRVITLDALAAKLRAGETLPRRTAVITIDDGYRDNLELAYPVLRRHRFPATIFLVSRRIGEVNDWDASGAVSGRPLLSLEDIARLSADGIGFGAHTRTHPELPGLTDDQVPQEIGGSRRDLEDALVQKVDTLTYPYGLWDQRTVVAGREADLFAACTTEAKAAQLVDDPLLIPRIEIMASDPLRTFVRKLWFGGG